jgi:CRP-like cAMP-binding protein
MISKLHDIAEEKQVPADEFIFREGERATKLFLVLKGEGNLQRERERVIKKNKSVFC